MSAEYNYITQQSGNFGCYFLHDGEKSPSDTEPFPGWLFFEGIESHNLGTISLNFKTGDELTICCSASGISGADGTTEREGTICKSITLPSRCSE